MTLTKQPRQLVLCLFGLALTVNALADSAFTEALTSGKVSFDSRLRYERVNDDNGSALDIARALTLGTKLGYTTGTINGFSVMVEMEDVRVINGMDEFGPQTPGFDTVADPEVTQLNQGYLKANPLEGLVFIAGRQRLILDNARFVGNVGFRQNEQTFDAFTLSYTVKGFNLTHSHVEKVNGILPTFDANVVDELTNISYQFPIGKLSAYYYNLDHGNLHNAIKFENTTAGLRFSGSTPVGKDVGLSYTIEAAKQDATKGKEAYYTFLETGVNSKYIGAALGYEVLGSDDGTYGFQTQLATKHAFNGWADKFLVTPTDGLEDTYLKITSPVAGLKMALFLHDFEGNESGKSLGKEMDAVITKTFADHYTLELKYADFNAAYQSGMTNTRKVWITGEVKF